MATAPQVALVDYGAGNLRSVAKALERSGLAVDVTSDPGALRRADGVVLPGVGAFADARASVAAKGLDEAVLAAGDTFVYVRHTENAWSFACGRAVNERGWQQVEMPPWLTSDKAFYFEGQVPATDGATLKQSGDRLRKRGFYREAMDCYQRAIDADPSDVWAWFDKGLCLERLGAYTAALDDVLRAEKLLQPQDGNRTWVHSRLGQLYEQLEDFAKARDQFAIALQLSAVNHVARRGLNRLRLLHFSRR